MRQRRDRHGWTQEELAEAADLDRSYVAGIEAGRRNPGLSTVLKLAVALGCRVGDLFPTEVESLPPPPVLTGKDVRLPRRRRTRQT